MATLRVLAPITALLVFATSAMAQDRRAAPVAMNGVGTLSCGQYLEYKRNANETMLLLFQQWSAGYMAGFGSAVATPGKNTDFVADLETYSAWLDKWCADDPLSNVASGVGALRIRLQTKK